MLLANLEKLQKYSKSSCWMRLKNLQKYQYLLQLPLIVIWGVRRSFRGGKWILRASIYIYFSCHFFQCKIVGQHTTDCLEPNKMNSS